jgi:hypothetical protein
MELHFWVRSDMPDVWILSVYRNSGGHQCLWIRRRSLLSVLDNLGCRDLSRLRTPTCLTKYPHKITRPWKYIFTHVAIPHVILHSTNGTGVTKRTNKHWRITHVRISSLPRRRHCPISTGAPNLQYADNVVTEIFYVPHDMWKAILGNSLWQQLVNLLVIKRKAQRYYKILRLNCKSYSNL